MVVSLSLPLFLFSILVIISFGSCLQLPVYNYSKDYSEMLKVSTETLQQLNSNNLIHKAGATEKDVSVMSEWGFHWGVFWHSDAIENAGFKVLVSITVHYIERIKELQEVWSTRFQDCFGSITLCSSGLFLQCEETYTITIDLK